MINPALILIENTLKSSFNLIIYTVYQNGEEHDTILKITRKKLFSVITDTNADKVRASLVDSYPPSEMQLGVIYLKRNGKTAWLREKEGDNELRQQLSKI